MSNNRKALYSLLALVFGALAAYFTHAPAPDAGAPAAPGPAASAPDAGAR